MLTKEQREAIYRLALQQQHADLSDYLDSITVPEGWKVGNELAPFHPSASHVEPGYRDGWNDCYRAMLAAAPKQGDSNEWMAELAARLRAKTTATMLDEYDMKAAADLIESMAQRVPLSEEQIFDIWQVSTVLDNTEVEISLHDFRLIARAIEHAHGIRQEDAA